MDKIEIKNRKTQYKKGGNAGVEGTLYQINLLIIFLLNGLKLEEEWYLSTENEDAGKFDDLVFESAEGDIFLQAKHKKNKKKKITLEDLLSTNSKNDDFSLPKYFFSHIEIRDKFNAKSLIISTNSELRIDAEMKQYTTKQNLTDEDMLYYEGSDSAAVYVFNDCILDQLKENIGKYYEDNLQRKNISKEVICDENIKEFLEGLQFLTNYPVKGNLDAAVEKVISETDLAKNLDSKTAYNYMYKKIQDWFKQDKGVYLTKTYAKALICEIHTNNYCNVLEKFDVHFKNCELPVKDPDKRVWHLVSQEDHIVNLMRLYRTLQKRNEKEYLLITPEHDEDTINLMIEAFEVPSYVYLIIACSQNSDNFVTEEVCDKVNNVLNSCKYKKLVIISEEENELAEYFRDTNLYQSVEEEVEFSDLNEETQKKLIKRKNVVFQGKDTSLEELLTLSDTEWNELVDSEMLTKFFRNEKIMAGSKVEALSEDVKNYYIHRTLFNTTTENFPEKGLCDLDKLDQKITLVSNSPGMGKSTVFTSLANALKERYLNLWVVKVDINSFTEILWKFRENKHDSITITELLNSQEETELKTNFENKLFSHPNKVLLIIDGIDEIAPDYKDIVSNLILDSECKANILKIYVSTRPHLREDLEKKLRVKALSLTPFTKDNQLDFLKKYWKKHLNLKKIAQVKKCEAYARQLVSNMSKWINDKEKKTLAEVPLQTRMLAEVFQERKNLNGEKLGEWEGCYEFLTSGGKEPKLPRKINLVKLYQMFMSKKRYIFMHDKSRLTGNVITSDAVNQAYEECQAYHQLLAMELTFAQNSHVMTIYKTLREKNLDEKNAVKLGIVEKVGVRYSFMHRTFAEFYVAECLFFELKLKEQNTDFQNVFTDQILIGSEFNVTRSFLDGFLQGALDSVPEETFRSFSCLNYDEILYDRDHTFMHTLTQEGHANLIEFFMECFRFIEKGVEIDKIRDSFNKSLLHYAAQDYPQLVRVLVEQGAGVNSEDYDGITPLVDAVSRGQTETTRFLLQRGANVNTQSRSEYTALHEAAETGNHEIIKLLLEHGADVGMVEEDGRTALHVACSLGHLDSVRLLVSKAADVRSKTDDGSTPLHMACEWAIRDVVEFLVDSGADVNEADNRGRTPLHIIAEYGNVELFKYLELKGADVQRRDESGCSPLHYAVRPGSLGVLAYLLETNDVDLTDRSGNAALHKAAQMGHLDVVEFLVSRGANVNLKNTHGRTALHEATCENHLNVVRYLVQEKAEVNAKDHVGRTPLHTDRLHLESVKFLLGNGADINVRDASYRGMAVLHYAIRYGMEFVSFLVDAGADLNLGDKDGRTSLHYAIKENDAQLVQYLIGKGADTNVPGKYGRRPIHEATEVRNLTILELLIDAKCDVNAKDDRGGTALHVASRGSVDLVKFLVDSGALVDVENDDGCTPLQDSIAKGELAAIEFLIGQGANVDTRNAKGCTPLLTAALEGNHDKIRLLIENGADVNARDNAGSTPFIRAVRWSDLATLKLMVERGADIHVTDEEGSTGLHIASRWSTLEKVRFLVDNGADVDATDGDGCTALHVAARPRCLEVVKFLVKKEANVNATDHKGRTPLHAAAARGCLNEGQYASLLEVMEFLIDSGTEVDARDSDGRTAMHLAAIEGRPDKVALLVSRGGDIDGRDDHNSTPSECAAERRRLEVVRFFETEAGAKGPYQQKNADAEFKSAVNPD